MPYLQGPAVNNPFGFQPAQNAEAPGQIGQYVVSTSFASQILPGDALVMTSSAGFLVLYTSGAANIIGVAAESAAASLSSAKRIAVYHDPAQIFVVQASTASTPPGIGMGIGITTTSTQVLTNAIRSRMMAGVVAPTLSSTGALRIVGIHPLEGIDGTTGYPANTKLLVKFQTHALANMPVTT